jgi:hypothetical protein
MCVKDFRSKTSLDELSHLDARDTAENHLQTTWIQVNLGQSMFSSGTGHASLR